VTLISPDCWSERDRKTIRDQLDRILKSGPFIQSPRRQRFLEYIVHETLAGRSERLKGYSIALEVFGRPETFDPRPGPFLPSPFIASPLRADELAQNLGPVAPFRSSLRGFFCNNGQIFVVHECLLMAHLRH
jgi:hypothetical protein